MTSRRTICSVGILVTSQFTFDNAKAALFYYIVLKQSLKASRHLLARGLTGTAPGVFGNGYRKVRVSHTYKPHMVYLMIFSE